MITIDGIEYNAQWVKDSFTRKAEIVNGDNSTRLQGNKDMYLEYLGTFFNFSGQIIREKGCSDAQWDNLFMKLSNPINRHTIKVPFNQGYMVADIYISSVTQTLKEIKNGIKKWDNIIEVELVTMKSQWLAGKTIKGLVSE